MDIRDRIRAALAARNLSMREASALADFSESFLRDFMANPTAQMGTENLKRLAEAIGQSPEYLLTGRLDPETPPDPETAEIVSILPRLAERVRREVLDFARWKAAVEKKDDSTG